MEYCKGEVGRIFVVRFDHEDKLLDELTELIKKEKITTGWIQLLGGMRRAEIVTGPETPVMPPKPVWSQVENAQELLASGSILWDDEKPILHLHGAMGSKDGTMVGCLRKAVETYLLIEAVIFEFNGVDAFRKWYPEGEFNRMEFRK